MKRLVMLYETYTESKEYLVRSLFNVMEKNLTEWFEDGKLGSNKAESLSVNKSIGAGSICVFHIGFDTDDAEYGFDINVDLSDVKDKVTTATLVSKKYDENHKIVNQTSEEIDPNTFSEDTLINKMSTLDEKQKPITNPETPELNFDDSGAAQNAETPAAQTAQPAQQPAQQAQGELPTI